MKKPKLISFHIMQCGHLDLRQTADISPCCLNSGPCHFCGDLNYMITYGGTKTRIKWNAQEA